MYDTQLKHTETVYKVGAQITSEPIGSKPGFEGFIHNRFITGKGEIVYEVTDPADNSKWLRSFSDLTLTQNV